MVVSKLKKTQKDINTLELKLKDIIYNKEDIDYSSFGPYVFRKMEEIKQGMLAIEGEIKTDNLTGILSKKGLEILLEETKKSQLSSGILYIDMMGLKEINDNYGHKRGDQEIKNVATELKKLIRSEKQIPSPNDRRVPEECIDKIYSLNTSDIGRPYEGGDEFVGVLSKIKNQDELRGVLERIKYHFNDNKISPIAIGATLYHPYENIEEKISFAEEVMYSVKKELQEKKRLSNSSISETNYGVK
tara:strand:+ start:911 stop:1645 length:735 start_codon:yes stop_codon:yes gene_type:complete